MSRLLLGVLGLLLCCSKALGQPGNVQDEPLAAASLVDQWMQEIEQGVGRDYESLSDSLLATFSQRSDSFNLYYKLGRGYYRGNECLISRKYHELAVEIGEDGHIDKAKAYFFLGTCAEGMEEYEKAIIYFDACFQQYELTDNPDDTSRILAASALNYSGTAHTRLGDFNTGLIKQEKGLAMCRAWQIESIQIKCLTDLGTTYETLGRVEEAIASYQEAFSLAEANEEINEDYAVAKLDISSIWMKQAKWEKAEEDLKTAIEVFEWYEKELVGPDKKYYQFRLSQTYDALGLLFKEKGTLNDAFQTFEKAITYGKKANSKGRDRGLGRIFVHQAELLFDMGKMKEAVDACQQAIRCLLPDMPASERPVLPDAASFYPEFVLLETLTTQAKCLMGVYASSQSLSDLNMAISCHQLANTAAELLRTGVGHDNDKLLLTQETHQRTEQALSAAYLRYQINPTEDFWHLAFELAERSKANLLLESFQDQEARFLIGLPDSILEREEGLQLALVEAEQRVEDLKESEAPDKEAQTKAVDALFYARGQMNTFKRELEEAYPNYFNLKYMPALPTLPELREHLLSDKEALIEFFMGDDYIYLFMLTGDEQHFTRKKNTAEITQLVQSTLKSLTSLKDKERASYPQHAYLLYQELLGNLPLQPNQRLIIVPDRELALIPFEALITQQLKENLPFAAYPFLIKEHICSYAYSAHLLFQTQIRKQDARKHKTTFLGMAPGVFPNSELVELPHTQEEVKMLKSRLGGKVFFAEQAQKEILLSESGSAQILHLSTHAVASDDTKNATWIAFRDGSEETIRMRLAELAALNLHADMTVLSACETGAGKIQRGEGVMSLARAFTYAGSQATIQSLWPVRPAAAAPLMEAFYEGLIEGKDKALALHEAKLSLLNGEDPALHAPLMWAAFAAIGDMRAMDISPAWGWKMWGLLGLGVVLLGFGGIAWRKRGR